MHQPAPSDNSNRIPVIGQTVTSTREINLESVGTNSKLKKDSQGTIIKVYQLEAEVDFGPVILTLPFDSFVPVGKEQPHTQPLKRHYSNHVYKPAGITRSCHPKNEPVTRWAGGCNLLNPQDCQD